MLSERVNQIGLSPTLKITAKAKAMKAEGLDVIDFSVGEPDFPTPENIREFAKKAIDEGHTRYTAAPGIPELRRAVADRLRDDYRLEYDPSEICVSNGGKHALYNLILALVNEGEEVLIPAPYWVSYPEMVLLAKGVPIILPTQEENGFKITADHLRQAISASTRALILNSPSNPTGSGYSKEELEAIARVAVEEKLYVITDEIYGTLTYEGFQFTPFASLGEEVKQRTITINGVSKSHAMTGWRIGYAAGPREIIDGLVRIQSHSTSNPCSIAQMAALEAMRGPQQELTRMRAEFEKRRNFVLYKLSTLSDVTCVKPQGAFYVFPNMSAYYGKEHGGMVIRNSYGLAYYLLKQARVALVPGDAFGADDHIRISFATSMEELERGLDRIIEALGLLKTEKKVRRASLRNTRTRIRKPLAVDPSPAMDRRDALVAEAEAHLRHDSYYEWNANINGQILQLRTNVPHLYEFWMENWYPAQLESDLEPHGIVYAVDGVTGREPHAFFSSESKTGILFNTDHYGSLRGLALTLVSDISQKLYGLQPLRGMSGDMNGRGFVLVGPPGTKKTKLFWTLMQSEYIRLHAAELSFCRTGGGAAVADAVERKFWIGAKAAESHPSLAHLFERSPCENVVLRREDCTHTACSEAEECRLDRGAPYCFRASKEACVLFDPYWLGGPQRHVKRTNLRTVFLLRSDPVSPVAEEASREDALRILEAGSGEKAQPFYNPYLDFRTPESVDTQRKAFSRLFDVTRVILLNTGAARLEEVVGRVGEALQE